MLEAGDVERAVDDCPLYSFDDVYSAVWRILVIHGVDERQAGEIAGILIEAEARGYASQGLMRLQEICEFLKRGLVRADVTPTIYEAAPSIQLINAPYALGHPTAIRAIEVAGDLALTHGVGVAGVIGSSHIGYLTAYVERAARRGLLAIATTVSSPAVCLSRSGKALLGTNPLAYAFPFNGKIFCADFSLAEASRGEVLQRHAEGRNFGRYVGYDATGEPSDTPHKILEGGIAGIGGAHKGSLINLLFSLLAGPLIGGVANHHVVGTRWPDSAPNKGDFFLCFNIEQMGGLGWFQREVGSLVEEMQAHAPDFHIPGEFSRKALERAHTLGLPLPHDLAAYLSLPGASVS